MKNLLFLAAFQFSVLFTFAQTTELWGTFYRGGDDYNGRIIAINNEGTTATEIHEFPDDIPGSLPDRTRMISYNNHLYGFLHSGGKYNKGIIFKYNPITNIVTKLFDFNDTVGTKPAKGLTLVNNKMYGICG